MKKENTTTAEPTAENGWAVEALKAAVKALAAEAKASPGEVTERVSKAAAAAADALDFDYVPPEDVVAWVLVPDPSQTQERQAVRRYLAYLTCGSPEHREMVDIIERGTRNCYMSPPFGVEYHNTGNYIPGGQMRCCADVAAIAPGRWYGDEVVVSWEDWWLDG
jgi:hypothetical protein